MSFGREGVEIDVLILGLQGLQLRSSGLQNTGEPWT